MKKADFMALSEIYKPFPAGTKQHKLVDANQKALIK